MPYDDNGCFDNSLQQICEADMLAELMDLMSQEGISESKFHKILDYVGRVVAEAGKD